MSNHKSQTISIELVFTSVSVMLKFLFNMKLRLAHRPQSHDYILKHMVITVLYTA